MTNAITLADQIDYWAAEGAAAAIASKTTRGKLARAANQVTRTT